MNKTNTQSIVLTVLITALIVGSGVYFWQNQPSTETTVTTMPEENEPVDAEFSSLLYEKENYNLPFGAAEIEGYYTTVERPTSLDDSTPQVTCSAFVVTDGPDQLLSVLTDDFYGTPPTVVIGSEDSYWNGISVSTKEEPVKVLATLNPLFEGELIGCMAWPFDAIIEIE